jgi:hypothetical protein
LQHRAERGGDNRLLGPLDPALARDLAAAAARSPRSRWEITVVDEHGYAIGHGIARPARGTRAPTQAPPDRPPPGPASLALPARVNISITQTFLHQLEAQAVQATQPRSGAPPGPWQLTLSKPGTWTLTLPGGRPLAVRFDVVPTYDCDHQYAVGSYLPGDRLRRLVAVRDHECTWPPCSRAARESDFEHAVPYDKGGITDACNAGARSRRCHRVKQMPGWSVTQPRPGKRGSYCPPVQAFDGLSELVAVPEAIRLRHSASVSGVRVIRCRAPGPRRAVRMPCLIQS